jgi:hypothetical protein
MAGTVNAGEIPPEVRKKLGITKPRERKALPVHLVKTYAFRVMATIADLSPRDRARVLRQAIKLNEV